MSIFSFEFNSIRIDFSWSYVILLSLKYFKILERKEQKIPIVYHQLS